MAVQFTLGDLKLLQGLVTRECYRTGDHVMQVEEELRYAPLGERNKTREELRKARKQAQHTELLLDKIADRIRTAEAKAERKRRQMMRETV